MTLDSLFILFTALFILAYKPGPGFFLNVSYGVKEGFLAALTLNIGVAVVCALYFTIAVHTAILGQTIVSSFIILVKGAGAAFLIFMGAKVLQEDKPKAKLQQVRSRPYREYFMTGFFLELGNPISIVFFLTLIPTLVPINELQTGTVVTLSLFVFCSSLFSLGSISLAAALIGKKFVKNERFFYYLNITTGVGLIVIGLFIAGSAISYL